MNSGTRQELLLAIKRGVSPKREKSRRNNILSNHGQVTLRTMNFWEPHVIGFKHSAERILQIYSYIYMDEK